MVLSIRRLPSTRTAVGIDVDMRGIEHEPDRLVGDGKARRHARGELGIADADAGEADAAEIVDALDRGRQQAGCGRGDIDEFRPHADLDLGARRQHVVVAVQADDMAVDPRLAAVSHSAGTMFMPGEPMK